ncbi:NifB/NifX family molybdenum-iron cluster-binding protein [Raoultella ornithinolytica]|uniref:NifB/NifX family molybdenum-iron cluster-binding protein n=1 Tax=Raoultella ornithinolytica TaxID=54291 RepID=UPI001E5601CA|nr:NifB/NifX family molybdenum-iron cluster-binding protein [Raoultella ornithinolytica]
MSWWMSAVWSSAGQKIPRWGADCSGKRKLVDLLVQQQVSRVVVRNIGERMLGKLLGHQIAVYQTDCGRRFVH